MSYFCVIITCTGRVITTSADDTYIDAYNRLLVYRVEIIAAHIIRQDGQVAKVVYTTERE